MNNELTNFGDSATAYAQYNTITPEVVGIEGFYHVECRDEQGNVKWVDTVPNLVVAIGKQLMFDTLLKGSAYTVTGPFLGLVTSGGTFAAADTMTSHSGWTEFVNYTVSGSAVRGTAVFGSATSSGTTPTNVTTSSATAITYLITSTGGTVGGCFLVTGSGAVSTQSSTAGTLYSAGNFTGGSKTVVAGDSLAVTYSTTATS
jgi:hypothetical protein